jgi:hypothetical protein
MKLNTISKVIISVVIAALFVVPISIVFIQSSSNKTKNVQAYNFYSSHNPYSNQDTVSMPYDSYIPGYDYNEGRIIKDNFNQFSNYFVTDNFAKASQANIDSNCDYSWSSNCSNFSLEAESYNTPEYNQEPYVFDVPEPKPYANNQEPYVFDVPKPKPYNNQEPYVFDVPEPKPYANNQEPYVFDVPTPNSGNYYDPNQPTLQDPLKPYYPEQDINFDNGYFNI